MTLKEREEQKAIWMEKATAHMDTPEIRKEAEEVFDRKSPIEECSDYKK